MECAGAAGLHLRDGPSAVRAGFSVGVAEGGRPRRYTGGCFGHSDARPGGGECGPDRVFPADAHCHQAVSAPGGQGTRGEPARAPLRVRALRPAERTAAEGRGGQHDPGGRIRSGAARACAAALQRYARAGSAVRRHFHRPPGVSGAGPARTAAAGGVRATGGEGRHAAGGVHGSLARLQAPMPPLSGGSSLQGHVPHRAARCRAGGHTPAGGRGGGTHHVRRSGFLQRAGSRGSDCRSDARGVALAELRRDDQGFAPAQASRPAPCSEADTVRVCDERDRVAGRRSAGEAGQGAHARGFFRDGRDHAGDRPAGGADVYSVPSVDDDGRVIARSCVRWWNSTCTRRSRRFNWRSGC